MSRCRQVRHLLSAYIDGDLSPSRARVVERHLAGCIDCSRELEQWRGILRLVSYHAAVSCPIDCAEAVLQRIEARQPLSRPMPLARRPPFVPRLALTVSLGALLGGLWLGGERAFWRAFAGRPTRIAAAPGGDRSLSLSWVETRSGDRPSRGSATSRPGSEIVPAGYISPPEHPLRAHAPDRLQQALGRSDSLILAADFVEEDQ